MTKRFYRLLSLILILLIFTSMTLIGCSKGDSNDTVKDETQENQAADQKGNDNSTAEESAEEEADEGLLSWQKDTSPFEFDIYFFGAWGTMGNQLSLARFIS